MVQFTLMKDQGSRWCEHHESPDEGCFCVYKDLSYFAQLVLGLLRCNTINSKATLGVIDQMEILYCLINADDVHKTTRVGYISSDLDINLTEPLHAHPPYLIACQGRFKSVPWEKMWGKYSLSLWG